MPETLVLPKLEEDFGSRRCEGHDGKTGLEKARAAVHNKKSLLRALREADEDAKAKIEEPKSTFMKNREFRAWHWHHQRHP